MARQLISIFPHVFPPCVKQATHTLSFSSCSSVCCYLSSGPKGFHLASSRLVQEACVHGVWQSTRVLSTSTFASAPSPASNNSNSPAHIDPFHDKLQHKTEQELVEMLKRSAQMSPAELLAQAQAIAQAQSHQRGAGGSNNSSSMDSSQRVTAAATPVEVAEVEGDEEEAEEVPMVNKETGEAYGPRGKEPTRFGDWEIKGRCSDF